MEERSCPIDELKEYSVGKKGSAYEKISENVELIKDNYKIMQLASPQISFQTKTQINNVIDEFTPEFNQMEFKKMSVQDGFGVVDFSSLFALMKRFVYNK
jgi:hypothetical protein